MSALTRPRGPLSPRVYWTRRLVVLGTALLLVVGIGSLLGRSSDGSSGGDQATRVSAAQKDTGAPQETSASRTGKPKKSRKPKKPPLAQPDGPCVAEDIDVTPTVKDAVAGSPVRLRLRLRTRVTPACTWRVSSDTLTLKITSGSDDIWTTRECPRAISPRDLVLRQAKPVWMAVMWSSKRSDNECSASTEWAGAGWYHVSVAALAGEPEDVQFELTLPKSVVITQSPQPGKGKGAEGGGSSGDKPTDQPSVSPSGAVEPNG